MKNIYHFSHECYLQHIIQDGQILTERDALNKRLQLCHSPSIKKRRIQKLLVRAVLLRCNYKLVGSYVWFTENPEGAATATGNNVRFDFDANDINAVRWTTIMKTLQGRKQKRYLKSLLDIAISSGDDPRDWWVTRHSVSLDKCKGYVDIANPYKGYVKVADLSTQNSHYLNYGDNNYGLGGY